MRIRGSYRAAMLAVAAAVNISCSAFEKGDIAVRPHIRQSGPDGQSGPVIGRGAEADTASIGIATPRHGTLVRRVCRAQGWSNDWIATAYENASGECPRAAESDSTSYAAILVRLDAHPTGTTLEVCADQRVPRGWELVRVEGAAASQRCPGAGRDGASAIRHIRRVS